LYFVFEFQLFLKKQQHITGGGTRGDILHLNIIEIIHLDKKIQMNEKEGTLKEIDKNLKLKGLTIFFFFFTSFIQELCV
jgi:hypothetical protein